MIRNESSKKVLEKRVKFAKNIFSKFVGLMFKSKINYGLVFIFNKENNLNFHTWFMFSPIDFVFLDKNFKVVRVFKNINPWRMNICSKAQYVVELKAGKASKVRIGDKISFK